MSTFDGWWRITWMEIWDLDYIDIEEPGHFWIDGENGYFVFGTVRGELDIRSSSETNRLDFSWAGQCELDDISGRGWLTSNDGDVAEGKVYIHFGDESLLRFERSRLKSPTP